MNSERTDSSLRGSSSSHAPCSRTPRAATSPAWGSPAARHARTPYIVHPECHRDRDPVGGEFIEDQRYICTGSRQIVRRIANSAEGRRFATTSPGETIGRVEAFLLETDERYGLDAIGVASFGPVNVEPDQPRYGWTTGTPKPGWANPKLLERLPTASRVPTALLSDVSGAALGEQRWGAARDTPSVAYATFGTVVGVGIVAGGRVLHGNGYPELGHLLVRQHPFDDFVGSCPFHRDCLEGLAAGPSVLARWGADTSHLDPRVRQQAFEILGFYIAQTVATVAYSTAESRARRRCVESARSPRRGTSSANLCNGRPMAEHAISADPFDFMAEPALGDLSGVFGAIAAAIAPSCAIAPSVEGI